MQNLMPLIIASFAESLCTLRLDQLLTNEPNSNINKKQNEYEKNFQIISPGNDDADPVCLFRKVDGPGRSTNAS
jgi:hypothetical protein